MTLPTRLLASAPKNEPAFGAGGFGSHRTTAALTMLLATACGSDEFFEPAPPASKPLTHENLYSLSVLPEFDLYLDEQAISSLADEPKRYVEGEFRHRDQIVSRVGIRLKGNDTLTTLSEKPSFKIKFNEFVRGQRFLGFEGFTLNNMHTDASMIREHLAYLVFRETGAKAPRTGYAWVNVNDEPYGLYVNIEPYNDDFLERTFSDPLGNLYEAEHGIDVQANPQAWDQDEGDDETREDLTRLAAVATRADDEVFYGDETHLDLPGFLRFVAAEAFIGHFDGYQGPHNFFVYNEPSRDVWWFLPWNLDQAWGRLASGFAGNGYLTRKCIDRSERCRLDYVKEASKSAHAIAEIDFAREAEALEELTGFAARGDPRKRHSNEAMAATRDFVLEQISTRTRTFEQEMDCLVDGREIDEDGDGWGTCFHDCNDGDADIHFGAAEVCDEIDNDCNGFADDIPECPCPSQTIGGKEFFFCTHVITWESARRFCEAQGHQLAKLDDAEQNRRVWAVARGMLASQWAIGLNDRAMEDEYLWLDGSEPEFLNWAAGQPAKRLPIFDCAFYTGAEEPVWLEGNCNEKAPFICSALE